MRLVLINQQLFYMKRREELPSYQDFTPLHGHMSAGARSALSSPDPAKSWSWGHLPLSDMSIHHSFKLSEAGWTRSVCSGSSFPEAFLLWHVERKQRPDSGPGQESRSRLLQKLLVCFFQKGSKDTVIRCEHYHPVKYSYKTQRLGETSRTMFNSNLSIYVLGCVSWSFCQNHVVFFLLNFNTGIEDRYL